MPSATISPWRTLSLTTLTIVFFAQLSVPVIAAAGDILFVGEHLTLRLTVSAIAILGVVALALSGIRRAP
jgi:drug/metabolite transporter (DMT)-like permease